MSHLTLAAALLLLTGTAAAENRTTELQARSYIQSAFITGVAQAILADDVAVGPQLRERLALPPGAGRDRVYEALFALTADRPLRVRKASADGTSAVAERAGAHPIFTLEGGAVPLVMVYDLDRNAIPYVALPGARAAATSATLPAAPEPKALRLEIVFGFDDATLGADARAELQREGLPKIVEIREVRYVVQGHADRLGSPEHNQRLSERRAEAVRDYLVERGVAPQYIEVVALGASLPQTSCEQEDRPGLIACLAPDRRVTVEIRQPPM